MRTTINLSNRAYRLAVRHARLRKIGLGQAISGLVRRGATVEMGVKQEHGLVIFDTPKHLPRVNAEMVKRLSEEW